MTVAWVFFALASSIVTPAASRVRRFEFTYRADVSVPEGARRVDLWLPYPTSDENQTIQELGVSARYPFEIAKEPEYGNAVIHLVAQNPSEKTLGIEMKFDVERREHVRRGFARATSGAIDPKTD